MRDFNTVKVKSMNCDECRHYCWYYDYCDKWDCEVDAREVHNCRDTPIRDEMVNPKMN